MNENGNGGDPSGFKTIILVEANPEGEWRVNFGIPPMNVIYLLEQIKFNLLSGKFQMANEQSRIISPSRGDIRRVEA